MGELNAGKGQIPGHPVLGNPKWLFSLTGESQLPFPFRKWWIAVRCGPLPEEYLFARLRVYLGLIAQCSCGINFACCLIDETVKLKNDPLLLHTFEHPDPYKFSVFAFYFERQIGTFPEQLKKLFQI